MTKKRKPTKAKWEWVATPDAEERLQAAFDIIFGQLEELPASKLHPSVDSDPGAQEDSSQLQLF